MSKEVITDMKSNTFLRHIRESFKSLGRNGWMTFASASAVTVTLILVGVFFAIMMNLNHMASSIESDVEIRVYIDRTATEEDATALEEKIATLPKVDSVTFSGKDEELDSLISSLGEEGEAFKLFQQDNPLNDVYVVQAKTPSDTIPLAEEIDEMEFTANVNYGQGTVENLFSTINFGRNIGIILIVGLLFTAMFLISNTIKITIVSRRHEIEIMRLVGATNSFIRWPFFLEGLWLGLLGSIIPVAAVGTAYYYFYDYVSPKLQGHFIQLLEVTPFVYQVGAILILLGAIIGVWGSLMSVRKFLKI